MNLLVTFLRQVSFMTTRVITNYTNTNWVLFRYHHSETIAIKRNINTDRGNRRDGQIFKNTTKQQNKRDIPTVTLNNRELLITLEICELQRQQNRL